MRRLSIAAAAALLASPALAHHPMGGAPMETVAQGLLSGIAHPVLGIDHLFFVAAVGVTAAFTGRAMTAPIGHVAGMLGGCALVLGGVALPAVDLVIALSLLAAGAVLISGRAMRLVPALALFGGFGLFHGWAFGETIIGQEEGMGAAVLAGYLIGLAATQWASAVGAGRAVTRIARSAEAIEPRLAGAAVAGVGAFLVLEAAEAAAFAALGI